MIRVWDKVFHIHDENVEFFLCVHASINVRPLTSMWSPRYRRSYKSTPRCVASENLVLQLNITIEHLKTPRCCYVMYVYLVDLSPLGIYRTNEKNHNNKLNRLRIPIDWQGTDQLALYKRIRGVEPPLHVEVTQEKFKKVTEESFKRPVSNFQESFKRPVFSFVLRKMLVFQA